ncbi:TetR/AcrR family transcriptional regulator [Silvimonas soli]|uniref:TetR/AcrR family transcriptional regulator n=1 Tax=Silvimonas soli TaxID=2980100 RepID=UPI0024B33847|nr:TetR/AcrR family transcriptional regulator [Silvimonas soli]
MTSSPRQRGRPATLPDQNARAALLDAATRLFARQGIAASTLAQVAREAGVTSAMVHYYFKNRDQLLDALVEERILQFVELVWQPVAASATPLEIVSGMVERVVLGAQAMPWMPPLWVREVLSDGGLLRERMLQRLPFGKVAQLAQIVRAGQQNGSVNPDIEPRLLFISTLAMTMMPLATAGIWRQLPGMQSIDNSVLIRHVTALLAHGLAVQPTSHPE